MHKTRETQIYVVHPIWATSMEKHPVLPFILSSKLKRYNLQHIRCNSLFTLTQSPLSFSLTVQIHIDQYNSLINSKGLLSKGKKP